MSRDEPIDLVRRANEWFAGTPFPELRAAVLEEDSWEAAAARLERLGHDSPVALVSPEVDLDLSGFPAGEALPSGRGRETWFAFWREWLEPWEELSITHDNYEQRRELVIVDVGVTGRGSMSGVEVGLKMVQLWTVRDGQVCRYAVFGEREDAVADAESQEASLG